MAAGAEQRALEALHLALGANGHFEEAAEKLRKARVAFIDAALDINWTWQRIGGALGISDTGARRFYRRNRRRVRGGDV